MALACEVLMTEDKTVLKGVVPKSYIRKENKPIFRENNNTVYANILDEMLCYKTLTIVSDKVSTIYIFELDDPMYLMSDVHNIGLKSYPNAYFIYEAF